MRRRAVHAALGQAVADHVLAGGQHRRAGALLQPADVGHAERRDQVGVLAVGLLDAPPARVARDVEDRRQALVGAHRAQLAREAARERLDQLRIPRGREADRLREAHRVARDEPVQALLVDDGRDAQARLFHEEALDLVGQGGDDGHLEARGPGHARDLPDARARDAPGPCRARRGRRRGSRRPRSSRAGRASPRASCGPGGRRRDRRPPAPGRGRARRRRSTLDRPGGQALDELALGERVEDQRGHHRQRREGQDLGGVGRVLLGVVGDPQRQRPAARSR